MNYKKIYEQLTSKDMVAKYTESHHIIPKCMGGTDSADNLVQLTPEAHYVAHQLLVKIYPDHYGLIHAANMMTVDSNGQRINNKLFGWIRRKMSKARKGIPSPLKGRPSPLKGRPSGKKGIPSPKKGIPSPLKGRPSPLKGRPSGKKGIPSPKKGIPSPKKGIPKPMPKSTCPHCNKTGSIQNITRWHFDNCKSKKSPSCGTSQGG